MSACNLQSDFARNKRDRSTGYQRQYPCKFRSRLDEHHKALPYDYDSKGNTVLRLLSPAEKALFDQHTT